MYVNLTMETPCDYLKDEDGMAYCPYDYGGSDKCRVCCGLDVDEDIYNDSDD